MKEHLVGKKDRKTYHIKKAMEAYCEALFQEAKCLEMRKKILSNRALINLWLKNYGKVVEDCLKAIAIDPEFIRPYVRVCEALVALEKFEKCVLMADKGLEKDKGNKILKGLRKEAAKGLNKQKEILNKKKEIIEKKKSIVQTTCEGKGIVLGEPSSFPLPSVYSVSSQVTGPKERNEGSKRGPDHTDDLHLPRVRAVRLRRRVKRGHDHLGYLPADIRRRASMGPETALQASKESEVLRDGKRTLPNSVPVLISPSRKMAPNLLGNSPLSGKREKGSSRLSPLIPSSRSCRRRVTLSPNFWRSPSSQRRQNFMTIS